MAFFWGLVIVVLGTLLVLYTESILSFAGSMGWAESWLRFYGGSRLGYKLVGIIAIIIGLLMMTGLVGNVVLWLFGGLFGSFGTVPVSPAGS
ncbi:hypothetical protein COV04_00740 [Candidatus Uhrbacteria bacterium CG10_big_fil_rev_8_21_14_0_10_48_11]|uniref:Uncharacterized protein n=1 Tax=Candidatus Uhrbacteria bacterium CG10_big_fil_rev_8_21_14_0_10_48_11 TaxID=1975037 RepID=A0A2M8LFH5_9BACT|nr:MAG: hypothetical protein COV04_00740 [Candidatus Uhrbacteria bacterium CG10_big_fil_rev_8_21_14_0_10_48_11]